MAKAKKTIVKTEIESEEKNALAEMFESNEAPVLTSVGYAKLAETGQNNWVSYVMKSKGTKVLSIDVTEPDARAVAEDLSKISFVNSFMSPE